MRASLFRKPAAHAVLIFTLCAAVYANALYSPFMLDDMDYLSRNPLLENPGYLLDPSGASMRLDLPSNVKISLRTRLLGYVSFYLNYSVHGTDVFGYHLVNMAVHMANSLLVYLIVLLCFRTPFLSASALRTRAWQVALFSAALFAAQPLQTGAVTYISQRFTSLAAAFCLASFACYTAFRVSERGAKGLALYTASVALAVLAMFTKEISFTLPVSVALFEVLFFRGKAGRRFLFILPLLLTMLIIPLSVMDFEKPLEKAIEGATMTPAQITRSEYFLTQLRVLSTYFRLMALPINQNLDYDYPVYRYFSDPAVAVPAVFAAVVFASAFFMLRRSARGRPAERLVSFGIFWYFIMLSVESSFIVLADVIFEHRVYLPSFGLFTAAATGAVAIYDRAGRRTRAAMAFLLVLLPLVLALAAFERNTVWQSQVGLWEDTVGKSPGKARAHSNLGTAYWFHGDVDSSIEHYLITQRLDPFHENIYFNLGVAYGTKGMLDESIEQLKKALKITPFDHEIHFNLAVAYQKKGLHEKAVYHFRRSDMLKAAKADRLSK